MWRFTRWMCAGCPQECRWRRRAAWPVCLQRTRIPRGSLRLVSRRREVFVPRNQRCGLLPTRPLRLLSPSAVGRLAAGEEAAEVVEAEAAERVAAERVAAEPVEAVGAVEGVAPVAEAVVRAEAVEAEAEGPEGEPAEAEERAAARAGSTPAALSITG